MSRKQTNWNIRGFKMETLGKEKKPMLKVTFYCYSKVLNKAFENVYYYADNDMAKANYSLYARSLNWQIKSVEKFSESI